MSASDQRTPLPENPNRELVVGIVRALKVIADAILKPRDIQKVSIEGASILTIKGDKGDKGDSPTEPEIIALIKPLIPEPIKGDKGDPLVWEDLTPEQKLSLKGRQGDQGEVDYLKVQEFVQENTPKVEDIARKVLEEIDLPPNVTVDEVLEALKKTNKLSFKDLKDVPDFDKVMGEYANKVEAAFLERMSQQKGGDMGSGANALSMLLDVNVWGIVPGQGIIWDGNKFVPFTPGGPGGANIATEMATVVQAGGNITIDLTQFTNPVDVVQWVSLNGQIIDSTRWSVVGDVLTITDAFDTDTTQVQYTYA